MVSITSWNIRGLNWPNNQEDVHSFLQFNQVGMIGLLETKVNKKNVEKITRTAFPGWHWYHNFDLNVKGCIWMAWNPSSYNVQLLLKTDQLIHCYVTQLHTQRKFYITFVYGMNQEKLRKAL